MAISYEFSQWRVVIPLQQTQAFQKAGSVERFLDGIWADARAEVIRRRSRPPYYTLSDEDDARREMDSSLRMAFFERMKEDLRGGIYGDDGEILEEAAGNFREWMLEFRELLNADLKRRVKLHSRQIIHLKRMSAVHQAGNLAGFVTECRAKAISYLSQRTSRRLDRFIPWIHKLAVKAEMHNHMSAAVRNEVKEYFVTDATLMRFMRLAEFGRPGLALAWIMLAIISSIRFMRIYLALHWQFHKAMKTA